MRGLAIFVALTAALVVRAELVSFTPAPGRQDGRIYYYVPESLDRAKPAALLVFLHGGNAVTPDTAPEGYFVTNCLAKADAPFIIAAPSAPPARDGSRWCHEGIFRLILATIDDARSRYGIDPNRVFLGGHSMGGFGAYHLGQILADRLAGVWVSSGGWWESDFRAFLGTPVYLQHGARDCAMAFKGSLDRPRRHHWCGVSFARAADELMTRDGVEHVYDEHGEGHSLGCPAAQAAMRRFFDWARDRRRAPYAKRCAVMTLCGSAHPDVEPMRRSRWLEIRKMTDGDIRVDGIVLRGPDVVRDDSELALQRYEIVDKYRDDAARIVAENLGKNRFKIEAENVSSFRIYLAKEMGDLAQPFAVDAGTLGQRTLSPQPLKDDADYSAFIEWDVPMVE